MFVIVIVRCMCVLRLRKVVGKRCSKEWWRRSSIYLVGGPRLEIEVVGSFRASSASARAKMSLNVKLAHLLTTQI
jgi:hypothetical protein